MGTVKKERYIKNLFSDGFPDTLMGAGLKRRRKIEIKNKSFFELPVKPSSGTGRLHGRERRVFL